MELGKKLGEWFGFWIGLWYGDGTHMGEGTHETLPNGDAMAETLATLANMRVHYSDGVFAYSPTTTEECSANPGDYWFLGDDDVLRDSEDQPMILVVKRTTILDVTE